MYRSVSAFLIALSFFTWPLPAKPTAANDSVVGTGTPASCTEAALTGSLSAGGTITFNCGGPASISFTSVKSINQDTTIKGGGNITLSGGLNFGLFHDLGFSFTLDQITLDKANNKTSDGSAVVGSGSLTLNDVIIQNGFNAGCGGAIWMLGTVHINHSIFLGNSASKGGAICTGTTSATSLTIVDSTFTSNTAAAGNGGAIFLSPTASAILTADFFAGNIGIDGGALYISPGGSALVNGDQNSSFFENNLASDDGAGIYNDGGTLTVDRTNFINNQTPLNTALTGYGGGINNKGTLTMSNAYFSANQARFGAGLCACNAANPFQTTITRSIFDSNIASERGGGLYANIATVAIKVSDTKFNKNTAPLGGGVARFAATMNLSDTSITYNTASAAGGGLFVDSGPTNIVGGYVEVASSTIALNTVTGGVGGGIYNQAEVDLTNDTIAANPNAVYNFGAGAIMRMTNTMLHSLNAPNCDGGVLPSSAGGNFSDDISCGLSGPGDQQGKGLDAKLGQYINNDTRANTDYYLLQAGSLLINAAVPGCPTLDQRHALRPDACDIGAVEFDGRVPWAYLSIVRK